MERGRASQDREARLAEALRANLRKRKAQGKSRETADDETLDRAEAPGETGADE